MILSIVIPAFNAQRYLDQTLRSVLAQTGEGLEVIVVDDGSTDETAAIVRRYASQSPFIRLISTENRGVSHARNVGMDAASGRYVAFLDADDVLCTHAYTPEIAAFLADAREDLISFGYIAADNLLKYGTLCPEQNRRLTEAHPDFHRAATSKHFSSRLYRAELLQKVRFFEGIRYSEDAVFSYLAARKAKSMVCLDRYWFLYRNHIHSTIHNTGGWDYLITDSIPAWYMAADTAGDDAGKWDCWGMVWSLMAQYLRCCAGDGEALETALRNMEQCTQFQAVLAMKGRFWTKPDSEELFRSLQHDPRRTWRCLVLRGMLPHWARVLSRTAPGRYLYFRLKYRTPLAEFLPGGLAGPAEKEERCAFFLKELSLPECRIP